jgi:hypothetical protein
MTPEELAELEQGFRELRHADHGKQQIKQLLAKHESDLDGYLSPWLAFSKTDDHVYPSQGLLFTPHDYISYHSLYLLPQETIVKTLRMRRFFLEMFNHPYRIHFLNLVNQQPFIPPARIQSKAFDWIQKTGESISIADLGSEVVGTDRPRTSRTARYAQGPFIRLGKQARLIFNGSESPDVWNSAPAIATMAASHCLSAIPRNGVTSDHQRQIDLAKEVFDWLDMLDSEILGNRVDRQQILKYWKANVMGTLSANPAKAIHRAKGLYKAGVRAFRVYSPEPGNGPLITTKMLRQEFGDSVEIVTGQIVDVEQAVATQKAGANALVVGVGGGGRCITGIRSGSAVSWPSLLWSLRGELDIPVIVHGGATEHVATTLLLGASGIGVSRVVSGGTIESPGGALYCDDGSGRLFKPYGGEASARTKYLDGKLLPFDIPAFVEGETTKAEMSYVQFVYPTLTYNLHLLIEDAILALVFRNVEDIYQLHAIDPSPLRWVTSMDIQQRQTH